MELLAPKRRAFTLIEMVVVLAIVGIALAVVAPSMILPRRKNEIGTVIADARNAALRRSEQMTLVVGTDGKWSIYAAREGNAAVRSGRLDKNDGTAIRLDVSPLGLCSVNESATAIRDALDPFTCVFRDSSGASQ